jgi:hypothetical protein
MHLATISGAGATRPYAWAVIPPEPPSPALPQPVGPMLERDLPLSIQRACTRIQFWRAGPFEGLGARDRAVLAEIVRCVDRRQPHQAVHVRRDTLAAREGCSVPTITRALARLVSLGWVKRDQVKSRVRGFQVGSVELTAEAIAWLGLLEPFEKAPSPPLCESPVIDASGSSGIQCIHRQPPVGGSSEKHPQQPVSKAKPGEIPASLQWLVECNVSRNGVFLLMRLARQRGVLLETVATLCRQQIESARMPFAYLRDLLGRDKDWAWVAQSQVQAAAEQVDDRDREAARDAIAQRLGSLSGRWWLAPTKRQLLRVEGGVFMVYGLGDDGQCGPLIGAQPDGAGVLGAIDAGRLVPW